MLNPLPHTEKVVRSFLRYQLTTYPFADDRLNTQMRRLLSLDQTRHTPLLKGPFISLSRAFKSGATVDQLVKEWILHEHMRHIVPFPSVYGHQEQAIRSVHAGQTTLASTGTGSGKSECFLYPIISKCLELKDQKAKAGVCAVIVYPMNALAEDQLGRLRELLAGSGITFGMYVGKTPETDAEVSGVRLQAGTSRADFLAELKGVRESGSGVSVHPPEEVCSREIMRTPGRQPRILLTNVKQLELLLTRQSDVELFDNARLDFLVFDEAHTFTGAEGAETACLVRRLRSYCGKNASDTVCVATSATIVDEHEPDAAREFASRFFGVEKAAVATVQEVYEPETWANKREVPPPPANAAASLDEVRRAVDLGDEAVRTAWKNLTGRELPAGDWEKALHADISQNELLYQAASLLVSARPLADLLEELAKHIGRQVSEEEMILWLILGAAARKDGRPLVRPVVHAFLRGVPGAVVTFGEGTNEPHLHLSAEDEKDDTPHTRLRVSTCTTCGQHYFEHSLSDFHYTGPAPGGGAAASDGSVCWEPLEEVRGGRRLVLLDRLISSDEGDEDEEHPRLTPIHICRYCGAAHNQDGQRCKACGKQGPFVKLLAVQQKADREGSLSRCVCCGANGRMFAGRFKEPAKPVRATNVADVHVLAQDMIQQAERKRLLVFADNRQDAAFQAGWMRDHARRFRFRALMIRELESGALSLGDLVHRLDQLMEADDALSMALLPEVWATAPTNEAGGNAHREERQYLLRIHVLMEVTMTMKQRIGLEPWGRLKVSYVGLEESDSFVQKWARQLKIPADELLGGIAAILDQARRKKLLHDSLGKIFSRVWAPGARELENGYLPPMTGIPKGLKFTREGTDSDKWVDQWYSPGRQTVMSQVAGKWNVDAESTETFLRELWAYLTSPEKALLVPVTLKGSRDNALPNCHGTHQVDGDKLLISKNTAGAYRCRVCRRTTIRRTPHMRCLAWRCSGELEHLPENPDNYDLQLIDGDYTMLRPREHTAMVPAAERENLEQIFKGDSDAVNTLVCTQTLELGVDIGALDAVLMRNVPPLPANYWQRVGRAGRRHRMAVNLTYCRGVSHDRAYFAEPLKMLGGRVKPPSFNLSNDLMVAKHVHATIVSILHRLARDARVSPADREEISLALRTVFPTFIRNYLFDDAGNVRQRTLNVGDLHTVITKHQPSVEKAVVAAFQQGWPTPDAAVVDGARLSAHVLGMTGELERVINRLHRRLKWALGQMDQLENRRRRVGALDDEEQAFYDRCRRYVRRLKSTAGRERRVAEGIDDIITYSVLAAEGFFPGYGLETGSVLGMAEVPRWVRGLSDFNLPRPPSVALREYVPGNLIYSNGQRFVPRRYARMVGEEQQEECVFEVNAEREAVNEITGRASGDATAAVVTSIPICDVTLVHQSRISDEEENRFQMGVAVYGRELGQHNGGKAYRWGEREIQLRKSVRLQLVNVGSSILIRSRNLFGYPVCKVCGQSISPFASDTQKEDFEKKHQEWCGIQPKNMAFHADLAVDALSIPNCSGREEAFSLMEGIRFAAAHILDMDLEDLQVLVIGKPDGDEPDALLYDPMPGGSGLLEQICVHFAEVIEATRQFAENCPSLCERSCIDCFQTYRNAFYHKYLNRHLMAEKIAAWGDSLEEKHEIPPRQPAREPGGTSQPVDVVERKLRQMLLAAGLPEGRWQEQVRLPKPLDSTTPDVAFDDPDDDQLKAYIYLDGLSAHIHGNPETRERDNQIRAELRAQGHHVFEITAVDLDDQQVMTRHLKRLSRVLIGREAVDRISEEADRWFAARGEQPASTPGGPGKFPFAVIEPKSEDQWLNCLPIYTLKAAASGFSDRQVPESQGWAQLDIGRKLTKDMFVAQVVGKSMEPMIPGGAWCVFKADVQGPRAGKVVLVQHRDIQDAETGGQYTVKVYESEKSGSADGGWKHVRITLKPKNPDFAPITLEPQNEDEVQVVAELIKVVG